MAGYQPLFIAKPETGLVQNRQEFLLPNDAYPILENAYVWREQIRRRNGLQLLGRLRRVLTAEALGNADGAGSFSGNIRTIFSLETTAVIEPGTVVISDGVNTFTDNSLGVLVGVPAGSGTINYSTTAITITGAVPLAALTISFNYFPGLPVMGLRLRELTGINVEQTVAWDTVYAYIYVNGWEEFLPGTTWTGTDFNFFWTTNYWIGDANRKIFWATNFSGPTGDPIRYTNGVTGTNWIDFAPQIDAAGNALQQALALLPFRGRLLAFNTFEGPTLATSLQQRQRIRWAAIGNPFTVASAIVTTVSPNAWRDDIRGQGGFLDIPTAEDITAVGFVRDNLVIYCERSTWQLRYTGRSIAPFQIERVNSELGAESTFSAVQFDTSLVGIGDKGVVECDSYKSDRIDIKIPDLVFHFNNENNGVDRVHGVRDFQQQLAYWIYPYQPGNGFSVKYPNRRLVYNYENDSWAIFIDSMTALGTYQNTSSLTWAASTFPWQQASFPWINRPALFPNVIAGNQQGFVHYLGSNLTPKVSNDISIYITDVTGNTTNPTVITSPNHNLQNGQIIQIVGIPTGTPFSTLNDQIFSVVPTSANAFQLWLYNPLTDQFTTPQLDAPALYVGGGNIRIRDNFNITSKKFNFIEQGQNIQLGFIDLLTEATVDGAFSFYVFVDYNNSTPVNIYPQNTNPDLAPIPDPDTFFNSIINTTTSSPTNLDSSKYWQRVFCPVRGNFITIQFSFSNLQMIGVEQENFVQIDSQILYLRRAGRQLPVGV